MASSNEYLNPTELREIAKTYGQICKQSEDRLKELQSLYDRMLSEKASTDGTIAWGGMSASNVKDTIDDLKRKIDRLNGKIGELEALINVSADNMEQTDAQGQSGFRV